MIPSEVGETAYRLNWMGGKDIPIIEPGHISG
jgi:hypothetical protein